MSDKKAIARVVLAVAMIAVGIAHFTSPAGFVKIVPAWLPSAYALVLVSGAAEIAGGLGLLLPSTRRLAGLGLIALYLAVFPANINMATHAIQPIGTTLPTWVFYARLPLQLVLIAWAWWVSRGGATRSSVDGGVVLVTGASSGIGRELAMLIGPRAKAIVLAARRKDRLLELSRELQARTPHLQVLACAVDVTDQKAVDAMLEEITAAHGPVDVLVNNAGFGDLGVFDLTEWKRTEQMIALNVTSLAYLTHRVLPGMVARGRGGILNISSGFGLTFSPGLSGYVGTKHFVTGFTECLRLDLTGTGVMVTQSCPGPVQTEFADNIGNFTGAEVPKILEISAAHCARASLEAFDEGRALVVPGALMKVLVWIGVQTPRAITRFFYRPAARMLRKKQQAVRAEKS
ncbi:MAG: SDR family NAD(P)-dependent oxidoreductase [Polyangiales bacterium]